MWQGLHVPWGHPAGDSQIFNSAAELGLSRAPTRAPGSHLCPGVPGLLCPQGPRSPLSPGCSALLLPLLQEMCLGQ